MLGDLKRAGNTGPGARRYQEARSLSDLRPHDDHWPFCTGPMDGPETVLVG